MWVIIGLVVGVSIGLLDDLDTAVTGAMVGAFVGLFLHRLANRVKDEGAKIERLQSKVVYLENELARLAAKGGDGPDFSAPPQVYPETSVATALQDEEADKSDGWLDVVSTPMQSEPKATSNADLDADDWTNGTIDTGNEEPSAIDRLFQSLRSWLLGGNTVVRIGIVVLFFGLAFLARYAVEHSLVPIEVRLAGIAAGAIGLLVVGWRLRHNRSGYALTLQGGGVAVLYLTIFAAMRMYHMIPPTLGFALLLAMVIFSALLAVLQNSQAMAVIGTAGGFAAPILASTGQGSHVLLFSYYLLLNIGVLSIAWKKAWQILNLVGFLFTFSITLAWGARDYRPELFASTEPFLIAFVLMYVGVAVLFAWRRAPLLKHYVDGTIVFGTPVVGFGLQAALVQHMPYGLAWSSLGFGGFYVLLARWLHSRSQPSLRLLVESFFALGVAFLTLTIPLAVDGKWTAAAWALEGAALLWVGVRQSRKLAMASGLALQLAAGLFFAEDGGLDGYLRVWPLVNSYLLGALLISLAGFGSSLMAYRSRDHWPDVLTIAGPALLIWSIAWWLIGGTQEIDVWLSDRQMVAAALAFFALSGVLATSISQRLNWPELGWSGLLALPGMVISLLMATGVGVNPLVDFGSVAWLLAIASTTFGLHRMEATVGESPLLGHAHTALLWLASLAVIWSVGDVLRAAVVGVAWAQASVLTVSALILVGVLRFARLDIWPFGTWSRSYVWVGGAGIIIVMLLWAIGVTFATGGDVAPLPYLPIFNPLDLSMLIAMFVAFRWWQVSDGNGPTWWSTASKWIAVVAFILINGVLLRAVHHIAGVPWQEHALFASDAVQTSLSLFWGVLGLVLTFIANRSQRRTLWMVGAGLLGVVVTKLFLVDMANTGTVARIVSFVGAGLLLMAVGYFSPLPPAKEKAA